VRSVHFHEAAIAEIVHETLYYRNVSKALGARFALAVEQATQLASEFPDMGSPYKYGTRRVFPRKFPFSLVYLVRESEVYVIALAPQSKKPGYWRSRADG
jgi:plasmid stabilization system protein ParE